MHSLKFFFHLLIGLLTDIFATLAVTYLPHPSGLVAVLVSALPTTWVTVAAPTHHVAGVTLAIHSASQETPPPVTCLHESPPPDHVAGDLEASLPYLVTWVLEAPLLGHVPMLMVG